MNNSDSFFFFNGKPQGTVPADDRGFCYGHGLFETARLCEGHVPLWRFHLSRLTRGAEVLGLCIDADLLNQYLEQLMEVCPRNGIIKVIVTAGNGGRGYLRDSALRPNYVVQWFPLPDYPVGYRQEGVSLKLCDYRLPQAPRLAGIKHLNRLDQVIARAEWGSEYPEGLLLDQQQHVIEAVSSNLFFYSEGTWFTPRLDQCGVLGVMRQYLLVSLLGDSGYSVEETVCSQARLLAAEEVFICNSVNGIWPVVALENKGNWPVGQHTVAVQQSLYRAHPCYQ